MSATIDVEKFSEYFAFPLHGKRFPAPPYEIDKDEIAEFKSNFPVDISYFEHMRKRGIDFKTPIINRDDPSITDAVYALFLQIILELDIIDKEDHREEFKHIKEENKRPE